jgi:intracellular sulfur oxidation DsrE/DsrF family protein
MNKNYKQRLLKVVFLAVTILSSTTVLAEGRWDADDVINTGIVTPCQQLYIVNDPNNPNEPPDDGGVCIDIPVNLKHVKVVFNIDTPVMSGPNPVALRHMWMVGTALKARIEAGLIEPDDISIIGVFHGSAMAAGWAFKKSPVADWINKILALANPDDGTPAVNMQLEVCAATLKGMQLKGATLANGEPLDERAVYPGLYVNQGAIARLIDLQQKGYVYIQEGLIDND